MYILDKYNIVIDVGIEMIVMNNFVGKPQNIVNTLALILK